MEYTLEKLEVYNIAENFSDDIWNIVIAWKNFEKDTIGKQLVRSADSISAILLKDMAGIFIKKVNNFISMPEVQYKKQNHGYLSVREET